MTVARGRVLKLSQEPADGLSRPAGCRLPRGRRLPLAVLEAADQAAALLARAEARAAEIVRRSEGIAADVRLRAETEGRANAAASVAARALAQQALEAEQDERALDRSIELAVMLAERLLGEALQIDRTRIVALARQALREVRGARAVVIAAHPDDATLLQQSLDLLGVAAESVRIEARPDRTPGSLRLETEAGVLDGELAPQLERLALRLRESLAP